MGMLHDHRLIKKKKSDREQSGAGRHQNEEENHDMTEVLHLGPGAKFLRWRGEDGEPGQRQNANRERIPRDDAAGGGLNAPLQREPNSRRDREGNNNAMPGVLLSDPIHFALQLSRNCPHRATLTENPEIRMSETADVRQNGGQIGSADAEPGGQRG
jgi:hypothetical protein